MKRSRSADAIGRTVRALAARPIGVWLRSQRDRYRADPRAAGLGPELHRKLVPYFGDEVLRRTLFVTLHAASADRPPFFSQLRAAGLSESVLSHFTDVSAITYQDVVVMPHLSPDLSRLPLVFHELVHVVQFDELGPQPFIDRYVEGWISAGFKYEGIPLECDAYGLQRRFEADPNKPFDVRAEVRATL